MKNNDIHLLHSKLLEMMIDLDAFCNSHNINYVLAGGNALGAVRHKGFIPWDDDFDVQMTRDNYDKFLSSYKSNDKYYLQKDNTDYPLQFSKLRANNTAFIEDIPYRRKYKAIHQGVFIDIFPVDKVSTCKFKAKMQSLLSNLVIAQSLLLRGYPKSHQRFNKKIAMFVALWLLPLKTLMQRYVKSFNGQENFDYYCSFYGSTNKIFQVKSSLTAPFERLQYETIKLPVMNNYKDYLQDAYGDYMKLPSEEEREYAIHAVSFSLTKDYKEFL